MAKMKMPIKRPPLIDLIHLLHVFANITRGVCIRKIVSKAKMFVNIRVVVKNPRVRMNLALGSIR
jgi:hypothetical protein